MQKYVCAFNASYASINSSFNTRNRLLKMKLYISVRILFWLTTFNLRHWIFESAELNVVINLVATRAYLTHKKPVFFPYTADHRGDDTAPVLVGHPA
jgi:hypothetical protein